MSRRADDIGRRHPARCRIGAPADQLRAGAVHTRLHTAATPGVDGSAAPDMGVAGFVLYAGWPQTSGAGLHLELAEIIKRLRAIARDALPDAETLVACSLPGAPDVTATAFRAARQAVLACAGVNHEPDALSIDIAARSVTADGRPIALTRLEFDLLAFLSHRPRQVFSREQLLEQVWGYDYPGSTRTVDTHISRLRTKLGSEAYRVGTVRGVGYRWEVGRSEQLIVSSSRPRS